MNKIKEKVGNNGINLPADVLNIQKKINIAFEKLSIEKIVEDGEITTTRLVKSPTIESIKLFQKKVVGFRNPDGLIEPNGKTMHKLELFTSDKEKDIYDKKECNNFGRGITRSDYITAAAYLGCEVESIMAVDFVESNGCGFFENGMPKILFEAHHFSKHTDGIYDDEHPDISSKKWNRELYKRGEKEYERLIKSYSLCPEAALKSASWGRYQILGSNYKSSGYTSVASFVISMFLSEKNHLNSFCKFIKNNSKLHDSIIEKDWRTFARIYNGPSYEKNKYDVKISEKYEQLVS
ncbi:N-acetylmuramidase family protein [Vibrio sonorensis]|uniref:N-acetylmuramidase family protein n=1 Tax=Vibrio sonorensis TaxID=1004316 RepID=UPI0008DB3147|nr:N-acetylmuramidase family protein [Vibrio sonorensis]